MVYETFLETIHSLVQERLKGSAEVSLRRIMKNNGLLMDGLTISPAGAKTAPTVYLNAYYEEAESGLPLDIITDQILLICEENPGFPDDLGEQLKHFPFVRDRIVCKLVNAEDNALLLSDIPHLRCLDLAVVFYLIVMENEDGQMTALIHNEHLDLWAITKEELAELAEANTLRLMPCCITPIEEVICGLEPLNSQEAVDPLLLPPVSLYVLTNERGINGATCLLYPGVLKNFADQLEDDLFILPSSIHEVLLAPSKQALPLEDLNEMVFCINESDVLPEDRLSDHIYCYSREQDCLCLPSSPLTQGSFEIDGTGNPQ